MDQEVNMKTLTKALEFASKKHASQRRKNGDIPYINHPLQVLNILAKANVTDYNVLCAGVLHDTVQDTETTPQQLEKQFNKKIKDIVLECSDDKSLSKSDRKRAQIQHAKHVSSQAKLVKIADKLSNNWDLFHKPPPSWSQERISGYFLWSYSVCCNLRGINQNLDERMDELFEKVGASSIKQDLVEDKLEQYYKILEQ